MARAIRKESIAFGLVNIPVGLSTAESRPDILPTGFHINERFPLPGDWKSIRPRSVTENHLAEFIS